MKNVIMLIVMLMLFTSLAYAEETISLQPHYDNFLYPFSYYQVKGEDEIKEAKFQLSVKKDIIDIKGYTLFFAYTQTSWFDVYNEQNSRPFRETNYNPQLFIRTPKFGPFQVDGGYWHESNGGTPEVTRSWERFYLEGSWIDDSFDARLKVWDSFWPEDPAMAEAAGTYEVTLTLKVSDLYLTVIETKAFEEVVVSHPVAFLNNLYSVYSYRSGKYDNQLDWDKEISRFSWGVMLTRR